MNYQEILSKGSKILKVNNIKSFNLDSEILLSSIVGLKRERLLLNLEKEIDDNKKIFFFDLIERRKKSEPVAYILGYKEFWKQSFMVNKNVLIPRPDTETLVENVLNNLDINSEKKILDIGTGSGCLIISVLKERKKCLGVGVDISKKAIKLAKYNAKIQHIENRIKFFNSDIDNFCLDKYDLIISNPPYIKLHTINSLENDIKCHEPREALDGGIDGYSKIKLVVYKSSFLIKKKGKLFLEVGSDQIMRTLEILKKNGFYKKNIIKDLSNKNRCIVAIKI